MPEKMVEPQDSHAHARMSTRELVQHLAQGDGEGTITLKAILDDFDERGFGLLLLIATLPAFIPIPIGGAISGPLVMFLGAQLLFGREDVWLPRRLAQWGPKRSAFAAFSMRISPWLSRIEHVIRPRLPRLFDHPLALIVTGLLLVITGGLLALPIPATNFLFGGMLLLFALALLERDGALLLLAWLASCAVASTIGLFSGQLLSHVGDWQETIETWWRHLRG